jgi:Zn-dependent M28 family amino/carboxypeptidase
MENPGKPKTLRRYVWAIGALLLAFHPAGDGPLETSLRADVTMLAETIGPRSLHDPDTLEKAADYIAQRFETMGWKVNRLDYMVGLRRCQNIEVEKRGTKFPDEIVVIGAHYDSVAQTPGADDNASGVAALLALAEKFSAEVPERTLRFVAFTNEEPEHFQTDQMGSRVYARHCKTQGDKVVAMLALESMGFFKDAKKTQHYPFPLSLFYPSRGNFLAIVGNRESGKLVKRVKTVFESTKVLPVESASLPGSLQGVGWSDHWSFWQEGYPAVMVTDTAPFRNRNYHRSTDTADTLDYARLAAAVRGLEVVVKDLVTAKAEKK